MDFKSMDAAKSDAPTGTPRMKKKKISSKFDQPKDESPAPTPKLKKKKIVQTIVTTDNEPKPGEPLGKKYYPLQFSRQVIHTAFVEIFYYFDKSIIARKIDGTRAGVAT